MRVRGPNNLVSQPTLFYSRLTMKFQFFSFIICALLFSSASNAAENPGLTKTISRNDYISAWKDEAIYQMVVHKIPASITLAQGILESGDGNSRLAREGNNHFGIKCHTDWTGDKIYEDDDAKGECFRKYKNAHESYEDHSLFLTQRKRYESLFNLETDDYKGWAKGLKACGYATNPKYPELLIGIIEQFNLHQYDHEGKNHIKKKTVPPRGEGYSVSTPDKAVENAKHEKPAGKKSKDERTTISITGNRSIALSANKIKYVLAKKGDTPESIAADLEMNAWQIRRYNDLTENDSLKEGQVIYTQPKKRHATEIAHTVKKGDTPWSISQQYGIRLKQLCKWNGIEKNTDLSPGKKITLKKPSN